MPPPTPPAPKPTATNGVIQGIVLAGEDMNPVENTIVFLSSEYLEGTSTLTDKYGFYRFENLPAPTDYTISFFVAAADITVERRIATSLDAPTVVSPQLPDLSPKDPCEGFGLPPGSICFRWNGGVVKLSNDGTLLTPH
jgi:hypothetical protein